MSAVALNLIEVAISSVKLVGINSAALSSPEIASEVTPARQAKKESPALLTLLSRTCLTLQG